MTRGVAQKRAMRFDWQKLVTPYTSKAWVEQMQAYEKDFGMKKVAASSLPANVAPIDWGYWRANIQTEGLVDELEAEYNAMTFAPAQGDGSAITVKQEASMVAEAEADVRMAQYEIKAAEKVLAAMHKAKNEGQNWTHEEWEQHIPGYNEQFEADYENEDYLPTPASVKLHGTDFKEILKRLQSGDKTVTEELAVDDTVGDISMAHEQSLIDKKTWSIARLYADAGERAKIQADVEAIRGK